MHYALHTILSLERRDVTLNSQRELVMMETIRLALIVFQGNYKIRLGLPRGGEVHLYRSRIRSLMMQHRLDWSPFLDLQLWILVVCVVMQPNNRGEGVWFVDEIVSVMADMRMRTWNSVMNVIRGLMWIDAVAELEVQAVGVEIDRKIKMAHLTQGLFVYESPVHYTRG
jgi:hypothetical protein